MHSWSSAAALAFSFLTSTVLAEDPQTCRYVPVWNTCLGQSNARLQCATFDVPADWTDQASGTISLNLIRYAAVDANNNINTNAESIIMNFGGPGEQGIKSVLDGGSDYSTEAGDQFHIVSFDPRGVGVNGPYNCVSNATFPSSKDFSDPTVLQGIYEGNAQLASDCNSQYPTYGRLVGTVADARDVRAIAQAVGVNTKLIRYWGFSYGTLLGDTIARLFPTELAGMVLDGNINPNDYWLQFPVEEASNIDAAILHFFDLCADATSTNCAWATAGATSSDLVTKWDNWVGADPTQSNRGRTSTLTVDQSFYARNVIYQGIKRGYLFTKCAQVLQNWYNNPGNIEQINPEEYTIPSTKRAAPSEDSNGDFNPSDSGAAKMSNQLIAITGADNQYRPGNLNNVTYGDWLSQYNAKSKYAGDSSIDNLWSYAPWIPKSAEFFTTQFANIQTSKEILFVQTPYDPVTPNISGIAAHDAFTNSVIVFTEGVGHCSSSQPSKALQAAVALYWTDGTVPTDQTTYALDNPNPFITQPSQDNTDEGVDGDANQQTDDSQGASRRKRDVEDYMRMWPRRDIDSNPATVGSCNGSTTSTTTTNSVTSSTSTASTSVSTSTSTVSTSTTRGSSTTPGSTSSTSTSTSRGSTTTTGSTSSTTSRSTRTGSTSSTSNRSTSTSSTTTTNSVGRPTTSLSFSTTYTSTKSTTTSTSTSTSSYSTTSSMSRKPNPTSAWSYGNPGQDVSWDQWPTVMPKPADPTDTNTWASWDPQTTQSTVWDPWTNQPDSIAATKTVCSGKACQTSIVAIPTVTTYIVSMLGVCETGLTTSTVTITATCTKGCDGRPMGVPQGYTTTQVWCSACAIPSIVTITTTVVKGTVTDPWSAWGTDGTSKIPADTSKSTRSSSGFDPWTAWGSEPTTKASNSGKTATDSWSAWTLGSTGKTIPADTSAKATGTAAAASTWSALADPAAAAKSSSASAPSGKPTEWSNVPVMATTSGSQAGKPAAPSSSVLKISASGSGTWSNVPLATSTSSASVSVASGTWSVWADPSSTTPLVAKYTGGAAAGNAVALVHSGALVAFAAAVLVL